MSDIPTVDSLPLTNVTFLKPSYNIRFHNGTEVVGRFDFNGPKMTFEGDVDASVELFVKALSHWFDGRLKQERDSECEKVAQWMIQRSYATGHGDTTEDLLSELEWQVRESERKAILNILWDYAGRKDLSDSDESLLKHLVDLIRARGET